MHLSVSDTSQSWPYCRRWHLEYTVRDNMLYHLRLYLFDLNQVGMSLESRLRRRYRPERVQIKKKMQATRPNNIFSRTKPLAYSFCVRSWYAWCCLLTRVIYRLHLGFVVGTTILLDIVRIGIAFELSKRFFVIIKPLRRIASRQIILRKQCVNGCRFVRLFFRE